MPSPDRPLATLDAQGSGWHRGVVGFRVVADGGREAASRGPGGLHPQHQLGRRASQPAEGAGRGRRGAGAEHAQRHQQAAGPGGSPPRKGKPVACVRVSCFLHQEGWVPSSVLAVRKKGRKALLRVALSSSARGAGVGRAPGHGHGPHWPNRAERRAPRPPRRPRRRCRLGRGKLRSSWAERSRR